jgi:hypothetical protein
VLEKFGLDPKTMPMKPMSVEQCVSEGLSGLLKNRGNQAVWFIPMAALGNPGQGERDSGMIPNGVPG